MTLIDDYDKLLARGMPPHPSVVSIWNGSGFSFQLQSGGRHEWLRDEEARDLITMHALRWFRSLDTYKILIEGAERTVRLALTLLEPYVKPGTMQYNADTLVGLLYLTEHLQPKDPT